MSCTIYYLPMGIHDVTLLNKITVAEMPDIKVWDIVPITFTHWASGEEIKEKVRITSVGVNEIYFEAVEDTNV